MIQIHEFVGEESGTHLLILGGIHGNEVCGPRALSKLVDELRGGKRTLAKGRLTIVPVCNPRAHAANVRFIEENLNRVFEPSDAPKSYERRLAQSLAPLVARCDALLDLHSMQSKGEAFSVLNQDRPGSASLCRALGTRWMLSGWPEVYRDHADKDSCCTQSLADRHDKASALIECGQHGSVEADRVAEIAIERALAHFGLGGLAAGHVANLEPRRVHLRSVHFRESDGDRLLKDFENFESLRQGDPIVKRADGRVEHAPEDGVIVFPSPHSAIGTELYYLGKLQG